MCGCNSHTNGAPVLIFWMFVGGYGENVAKNDTLNKDVVYVLDLKINI